MSLPTPHASAAAAVAAAAAAAAHAATYGTSTLSSNPLFSLAAPPLLPMLPGRMNTHSQVPILPSFDSNTLSSSNDPTSHTGHTSSTPSTLDDEKRRDAILWDLNLTFPQAFQQWVAAAQRERVFSDAQHAEMVRVLNQKETNHKRYNIWIKAGYFVVIEDGKLALYIRVKEDKKAAPRGKPAARIAQKAAEAAAAVDAIPSLGGATGTTAASATQHDVQMTTTYESKAAALAAAAAGTTPDAMLASAPKIGIRKVLPASEIPPTFAALHDTTHQGIRALYQIMASTYHGIPRVVCDAYIARCATCMAKAGKKGAFPEPPETPQRIKHEKGNQVVNEGGAAAAAAAGAKRQADAMANAVSKRARVATGATSSSLSLLPSTFSAAAFGNMAPLLPGMMLMNPPGGAAAVAASLMPSPHSFPMFASSPALNASLTGYWSHELRTTLLAQMRRVHPRAVNDTAVLDEVPSSLQRTLSITPRALFELARGLSSVTHMLLMGIDSNIPRGKSITAANAQGLMSVQLHRLLRGNSLAHRFDVAGRESVRERGQPLNGNATSLPTGLVRFLVEHLVVPISPSGINMCPNLSSVVSSRNAESSAALDAISLFLGGTVIALARELLESAGIAATASLSPMIQTIHLREAVTARGQELFPLNFSLEFSPHTSIDASQVLESVDFESATTPQAGWWTGSTVEQEETAMELMLAPSKGGYGPAYTRWGITLLGQAHVAEVSESIALVSSSASAPKSKRGAAAAANASVSGQDVRAHESAYVAFASTKSADVLSQTGSSVATPIAAADSRRTLADVELIDGMGQLLTLRVERWQQRGASDEDPHTFSSMTVGSIGRISNRVTGRVIAEILPPSVSTNGRPCLLLENDPSMFGNSQQIGMLELNSFVPHTVVPASQSPHMHAADIAQQQAAAEYIPYVLRAENNMGINGLNPLPPLAPVLQQVIWLLDHAEPASFASAQPLPLRVGMKQRILHRYIFTHIQHAIAETPNVLQIIAEFDPALLPHTNLPSALGGK
jgi:hypothetical protein